MKLEKAVTSSVLKAATTDINTIFLRLRFEFVRGLRCSQMSVVLIITSRLIWCIQFLRITASLPKKKICNILLHIFPQQTRADQYSCFFIIAFLLFVKQAVSSAVFYTVHEKSLSLLFTRISLCFRWISFMYSGDPFSDCWVMWSPLPKCVVTLSRDTSESVDTSLVRSPRIQQPRSHS